MALQATGFRSKTQLELTRDVRVLEAYLTTEPAAPPTALSRRVAGMFRMANGHAEIITKVVLGDPTGALARLREKYPDVICVGAIDRFLSPIFIGPIQYLPGNPAAQTPSVD